MTTTPPSLRARRALSALWGLGCHGTFLVAVGAMFVNLASGMQLGRGTLSGEWRWVANAALALQFPLLHSFLLSARGRPWLGRLAPRALAFQLAPTTYAWIASTQILATFLLWSPGDPGNPVWLHAQGVGWLVTWGPFLASWAFLGKALLDGGLGLQTGWIGWTAAWRGLPVRFPPLKRAGLFARCRQPIYLGFALTLWTGPVWTPDRLLLGLVWTTYCFLGPLHKERRFLARYGDAFSEYQQRVPYILPLGTRREAA